MQKRTKVTLAVATLAAVGLGTSITLVQADGYLAGPDNPYPQYNIDGVAGAGAGDNSVAAPPVPPPPSPAAPADERADVAVDGTQVENIRPDASREEVSAFCEGKTDGTGKADKGGTCVSASIGEVAKDPVRVSMVDPPSTLKVGQGFDARVVVADSKGPIDLNAFTADKTGKAGDTFLEHPGELDKDGRPLAHCHLGVATLDENGFPVADNYDAAFSGVQGIKGDLTAKVGGLKAGKYRGDVWCSQPGHLILPTSKADKIQAIDSFRFEVK